jgi:hypothetical protein
VLEALALIRRHAAAGSLAYYPAGEHVPAHAGITEDWKPLVYRTDQHGRRGGPRLVGVQRVTAEQLERPTLDDRAGRNQPVINTSVRVLAHDAVVLAAAEAARVHVCSLALRAPMRHVLCAQRAQLAAPICCPIRIGPPQSGQVPGVRARRTRMGLRAVIRPPQRARGRGAIRRAVAKECPGKRGVLW